MGRRQARQSSSSSNTRGRSGSRNNNSRRGNRNDNSNSSNSSRSNNNNGGRSSRRRRNQEPAVTPEEEAKQCQVKILLSHPVLFIGDTLKSSNTLPFLVIGKKLLAPHLFDICELFFVYFAFFPHTRKKQFQLFEKTYGNWKYSQVMYFFPMRADPAVAPQAELPVRLPELHPQRRRGQQIRRAHRRLRT